MGTETGASESDRSIIPNSYPAGSIALDKKGCITALNDTAAELLGRSRVAMVGLPLATFLEEDATRVFEKHLAEAASGRRPVRCELELLAGPDRAKRLLVQTLADPSGGPDTAYRAVIIDLTSYLERIEDADRARINAERVARSKTDFLARLSHEIRSSLASMIGFADILHDRVPARSRDLTEMIRDGGRHLLDTLNSVMDLARLEFQKGDLELAEVDLVQRVRERTVIFRKPAEARGLDLLFRAESERAVAHVNPTFVDRVVHNLLDNAIKYTHEGKVEVSVEQRNGSVWIYVADTGIGIRDEFLPRLFSPFEREMRDGSAAAEGVGLGLAITKYLVELMDGRITACSSTGDGSTFTVTFPARDWDAKEASSESTSNHDRPEPSNHDRSESTSNHDRPSVSGKTTS